MITQIKDAIDRTFLDNKMAGRLTSLAIVLSGLTLLMLRVHML